MRRYEIAYSMKDQVTGNWRTCTSVVPISAENEEHAKREFDRKFRDALGSDVEYKILSMEK